MAGYELPTERLTNMTESRGGDPLGAVPKKFSGGDSETVQSSGGAGGRHIAAFATGLALVMVGMAGLHHLYRSGDSVGD